MGSVGAVVYWRGAVATGVLYVSGAGALVFGGQGCCDQELLAALSGKCAPALPPAENSERDREGRRFQTEFSGHSTHQCCHLPNTATGSSIPNRLLRTRHAPALPHTQSCERVVDDKQNSENAPRASACETAVDSNQNSQDAPRTRTVSCPKQRESHRFQREF